MQQTADIKKKESKLKHRYVVALISILCAFAAAGAATFAWYYYNTGARTTKVEMAAGASRNLQISNAFDGPYGYTTVLDSFEGALAPVSTDLIDGGNGFQEVENFIDVDEAGETVKIAVDFKEANPKNFYKTSLFLRAVGSSLDVYLTDISYQDDDEDNPVSTAIRIGLVTHQAGKDQPDAQEFIFSINDEKNPLGRYNTLNGYEGCVLDHTKTDGSVVDFSDRLLSKDSFALYDASNGGVTPLEKSVCLCGLDAQDDGEAGDPVQVDVYIWLEGCDTDCANNLFERTIQNITLSFAGNVK